MFSMRHFVYSNRVPRVQEPFLSRINGLYALYALYAPCLPSLRTRWSAKATEIVVNKATERCD
jgi:hypothetical protein